jgi:hypothetical protein
VAHPGSFLVFFGLLCLATPFILFYKEQGSNGDPDDDSNLISWLMRKTVNQMMLINGIIMAGLYFINIGAIYPN